VPQNLQLSSLTQLQVEADGGGFATFSNLSAGSRRVFSGEDMPEITFEIRIVAPPPRSNLAIYTDLYTPSGARISADKMAPGSVDALRNVEVGGTYVVSIASRDLAKAGRMIMRVKGSAIR
jgi:hypothetical protein